MCRAQTLVHDRECREVPQHHPHRQFPSPRVRVVVETLLFASAASEPLHTRPPGWAA